MSPRSDNFSAPNALIGASVFLLLATAIFGHLNVTKVTALRSTIADANFARELTQRSRVRREKAVTVRESAIATEKAQLSEREQKALAAERQLAQVLIEKTQLETKLHDKESEVLVLQKQMEENQSAWPNPGAPSTVELQAQLDDARQQLDIAEREKRLLSEKVQAMTERSAQLEEKKRRALVRQKAGVQGKVLVVNQAYNFVVLNLGGRNGVEPHSEMLIVRDGTYIGKIRISSVEPATAIGDIIISTLARGVQVQPGDTVIYAGTNS